ncbi:MAG: AAA family ATPase [Candidatus Promineofilum sp.]|nr:AAA family ATPase [Promineifilum sp.]
MPDSGGPVVPARDVAGERRVITVLFCDVVGSTSLASRFDPEEWAEVMNEAFRYMIAPIEEYGGMVARLMGDAVLAFFGAPLAHEDDPQRAVLAGLGIINGIRPFIQQFKQDYGWEFNVRVGINTGPVVVGEMGPGQAGEYTAMGDAINLAARMEQTAAPGTVQIAEDTYRLIAPLFDVWDLGDIAVKGKEQAIHAYCVLGLEPQPSRMRGLEGIHAPLIGRSREMGRLGEILSGLHSGQSRICYLIGEAGLGKSRLIAETRKAWRDQLAAAYGDINPLWRGWAEFVAVSYGASRPYDMLKRQVRTFCNIRESDPPAVIHERLDALISLYPAALHERMYHLFGFLLGDTTLDDGTLSQGEAFQRELRAVIEQMAQVQLNQGPVVYVIDDVHWADVASLETIRNLLPLVRRHPVLFLFAMRPDWNTPGWQLYLETQMDYADYSASIYLEPLSSAESRTLVHDLLEDANVPDHIYNLIEHKAEGNPFFVEETVRTLLDSGALRREAGGLRWQPSAEADRAAELIGLPGNVLSLLTARIDRLESPVRRTMQLAAVIGRSFPLGVLQRIADRPADVLGEHLKRLAQADLVRPTLSGAESEYAFRHALTRDAAYETILLRQRRRYHRRVAEAMEALYADRLSDEAPRLAYHFAEGRDWPKAIRYYTLAGEVAARLYANSEAIEHYSQALDICRANPTVLDDPALGDLYWRLGRVYEVAGRHDEALRIYEELERLGRERERPALELVGLMPQAILRLTPTAYEDAERGQALTDRILALAEQSGRPDAEAHGRWARLLLFLNLVPDAEQAVAEGERALALARANGLTELEAYVLNDIGRAYANAGRADDAFVAFEQAYERWRALGNEPMMADALSIWSQGLLLRGDLAEAERRAREGLEIGRRIGNLWAQAFNSYSLAYSLLELGRVSEAIEIFWSAAELATRGGFRGPGAIVPVVLRWVLATMGLPQRDRERLLAMLQEARAAELSPARWQFWETIDHYCAGDVAGAYALLGEAGPVDVGLAGPEAILEAVGRAEIALAAGHPDEALTAVDRLLAHLAAHGFHGMEVDARKVRGDALGALGRTDEARAAYEAALVEARRQGARRAQWPVLAALHDLEGDPAQREAYRRAAADVITFIGDHLDDDELRQAFLALPDVHRLHRAAGE